jgi:hypothetical protein
MIQQSYKKKENLLGEREINFQVYLLLQAREEDILLQIRHTLRHLLVENMEASGAKILTS